MIGNAFFKQKNVFERLIPLLFILTFLVFVYSFFSPSLPRFRPSLSHIRNELSALLVALFAALVVLKRQKWKSAFSNRTKTYVFYFFATFILVLLTRLPYLVYHLTLLNADKSVTLLMVKNIAQGDSFPIYFYGQFYQGSLPAYLYAFLYKLLPQLNLSVLAANFLVYALFISFAALLIGRVTGIRSFFYPIVVLSLPLAGMNLFTSDMVRGIPFIIFFEFLLLYLVYGVIFEKKRCFFLIGVIGGILYWMYLPSIGFILIAFGWLVGYLLVRTKIQMILRSSGSLAAGFCVGNFPHILAEINNYFINTKFLIFSPRTLDDSKIFDLASFAKMFESIFFDLDVNTAVSFCIFLLFVLSFGYILFLFFREKDFKKTYLLIFFLGSLVFLFLSGYPPTPRYLIHYRVYSLFPLVLIIQALQEMKIFQRKGARVFFLLVFVSVSVWKTGIRFPELREIHRKNKQEIAALDKTGPKVILGNYWDVMRLDPFVKKDKLLITAPSAGRPAGIFTFSKYYPAALKLGDLWGRTSKAFLAPSSKSEPADLLLDDFGVTYERDDIPPGRYTLYSNFSIDLSPVFYELFKSNLENRYLSKKRNLFLFFKEKLADIPEPLIQNGHIRIFNPLLNEVKDEKFSMRDLRDWRYVLKKGSHRISFPLDFSRENTTFAFPEFLAVQGGTYEKYIYFLNMPIFDFGEIDIGKDFQEKQLIISDVRDSLVFTPMRDEERQSVRGLPLEQLEMTVLDPSIHTVECELYSFFNFHTTIWTNRYEQVVYVNGTGHLLMPGENNLTVSVREEKTLRFDTKHKSLLLAKDSRGNIHFPNTGVVLERLKVYREDSSSFVVPFLKKGIED